MRLFSLIEKTFKYLLPTPFTIAILLTVVTFILALLLTPYESSLQDRSGELLSFWERGLWNPPLLVFAIQMMLMLVLGHALALTKSVDKIIRFATKFCTSTATAAGIVTFLTVMVSLFNWGLGLIFGAILARKVGEHAQRNHISLNYPLVGAAGYSGLMVWHGGISGSAPIKVSEEGHITELMSGLMTQEQLATLPDPVLFSETIFGTMNIVAALLVLIVLPLSMYLIGRKVKSDKTHIPNIEVKYSKDEQPPKGVGYLDRFKLFPLSIGVIILGYIVYGAFDQFSDKGLGFINPNFINLLLISLCLILHRSIIDFLKAIDSAIGGASGILIQFPLYFGIMGVMSSSGLVTVFSDFFVGISNETTFPVFTFISAGIVNIFVPSGGGQWGVQGPIIINAATELGASVPKSIMALAYGDQLTNMLQPFWALPLLGITGLKAKQILPYTLVLMCVGILIYVSVLLLF